MLLYIHIYTQRERKIYIYIYIEREREREGGREGGREREGFFIVQTMVSTKSHLHTFPASLAHFQH